MYKALRGGTTLIKQQMEPLLIHYMLHYYCDISVVHLKMQSNPINVCQYEPWKAGLKPEWDTCKWRYAKLTKHTNFHRAIDV